MDWHKLFIYDESSPTGLRWKVDIYNSLGKKTANGCIGEVAGEVAGKAAARVVIDGRCVCCHIIVWEMHSGPVPAGMDIDHFDGCDKNNKIGNLRCVSRAVNNKNKKQYANNSSGVAGVKWLKDSWAAQWVEETRRKLKTFAVSKYGFTEAFRLACEHRAKMIEELNAKGAGYTERHGG